MFERVDTFHDTPRAAVNKIHDMIQACRTDIACMTGSKNKYHVDYDTIKVAEALVDELKYLATYN